MRRLVFVLVLVAVVDCGGAKSGPTIATQIDDLRELVRRARIAPDRR